MSLPFSQREIRQICTTGQIAKMVGEARFELAISCTQNRRLTGLGHTPIEGAYGALQTDLPHRKSGEPAVRIKRI